MGPYTAVHCWRKISPDDVITAKELGNSLPFFKYVFFSLLFLQKQKKIASRRACYLPRVEVFRVKVMKSFVA